MFAQKSNRANADLLLLFYTIFPVLKSPFLNFY